jgi:outer membrane immunogenic protein
MKRFALGVTAIMVAGVPALAADIPAPVYKAPVVAPVVYSWTGFYVGGNVGYSWGRGSTDQSDSTTTTSTTRLFRGIAPPANEIIGNGLQIGVPGTFPLITTTTAATATSGTSNVNGFIGGGQAGYNWQKGQWVYGLETDLQYSAERGSFSTCDVPGCPAGSTFGSATHRLNWFGTFRGRAGFLPTPQLLLYATGGLAYGGLSADYVSGINGGALLPGSVSTTRLGWTVGAGGEAAINQNWSFKVEYLYMDLGSFGANLGSGTGAATVATTFLTPAGPTLQTTSVSTVASQVNTRFTDHLVRIGLNYRFGAVEAVSTRY